MRRFDKQITDEQILNEILEKSEICRLGLINHNIAYIVPVNYAYEDGVIYIHSAKEGTKIDLLKKNQKISFEIELHHEIVKGNNACQWTAKFRSVMGTGIIQILEDKHSKCFGLDKIMRKYGADFELFYEDKILEKMTILKLKIESINGKQSGDWT